MQSTENYIVIERRAPANFNVESGFPERSPDGSRQNRLAATRQGIARRQVGYLGEITLQRFHFQTTESTNDEARRLATEWPGETLLVSATTQTAGRGRQQREWQSPRGGAWLSVVWPARQEPRGYQAVSLMVAVAVRRALVELAPERESSLEIKWPNDILIDDRKVAGILCEQWSPSQAAQGVLILGVGINVNIDPETLGNDLRHPATSLRTAWGKEFTVESVVEAVGRHLETALQEFEKHGLCNRLLDEFRAHMAYVDQVTNWQLPSETVAGRVVGIDNQGQLLLERDGVEIACNVGEYLAV